MTNLKTLWTLIRRDEKGATAIEYGLIAAFVSVVIIGAVTLLGGKLQAIFNNIQAALP